MTESYVTQCPQCHTRFRVNRAQLGAAHGAVRCGACLHVFNAAQQLRAQGQQLAQPAATAVAPPAPAVAPALSTAAPPRPTSANPPAIPAKPETKKTPSETLWIHDDLDLDSLDLDEELAKLEEQEQQLSQQFLALESATRTAPTFKADKEQDAVDQDERWAEALLREDEANAPLQLTPLQAVPDASHSDHRPTGADATIEPAATTLREPSTPPARALPPRSEPSISAIADEDDDTAERRPTRHAALNAKRDEEPAPDEEIDADPPLAPRPPRRRSEPALRDEALLNLNDDPLDLDWQPPRTPWGRWLGWGLLNLIAVAALAGQYMHYHFAELARQDQYRPWFEQLCPSLGCTLPSKVDISQIKSSNLVVRSHPEFSGALVVDAILYNRAPFAQPFPLLEMRFADINGKLLASRRFKPSEYLAGELAGKAEMPTQTPIHVSLDILDPGARAVNYSLSFHSPE
ncbi:MJ0042 family finger-like domain-containing protein [Pseudomonas cuatrocienegasensis]|uniref:MJ0042 family finger-like domain-containing protein n=1 Tax=Pseudomonas cuatrocienegasensis TaxID=543360 RepID=A0ABY1BGH5_9PSED|nr:MULTISPECIES: DUF3426 domain-containing protein [Pseudomonas]OEC34242.1 hypothetical protein A7D25_14425 [Pseudomonas sp. 21C1]SEQ81345.1 MJ0042 family finger-like domain-containing protein [Pseudomonas cuatrocienegasensis]